MQNYVFCSKSAQASVMQIFKKIFLVNFYMAFWASFFCNPQILFADAFFIFNHNTVNILTFLLVEFSHLPIKLFKAN